MRYGSLRDVSPTSAHPYFGRGDTGGSPRRNAGSHSRAIGEERQWRRLESLAHHLDARFRVPGTSWRFGWDTVIGLVPGVGDAASAALSGWTLWQGYRLGASKLVLARMAGNVAVDTVIGAVPLVGDVFDAAFKANRRNVEILRRHLSRNAHNRASN